jgi:hypothetical protein
MRIAKLFTLALLAAAASACSSANLNVKETPPEFPDPLAIDGYFHTDGLREYDGNIVDVTFLGTGARKGELLHVELWPFAGVGIGLFGFRVQLLPLDFGVGTLLYEPSAETGDGDGAEEADDD